MLINVLNKIHSYKVNSGSAAAHKLLIDEKLRIKELHYSGTESNQIHLYQETILLVKQKYMM